MSFIFEAVNQKPVIMQAVCPITDQRINEQVARLNAVVTFVLAVSFIIFNFWPGLLFLMIDFIIRGFFDGRYSPLSSVNKQIAKQLNLKVKMINAGPKIFAAQVGGTLSALALLTSLLDCSVFCIAAAGILAFFSLLEAAFSYCVACQLYPFFRKSVN